MKKLVLITLIILTSILVVQTKITSAADCQLGYSYSNEEELKQIIASCEQKTKNLQQQVTSLSSQIQYMDTQMYITTLKIQETEQKIATTEKEIETLGSRIEGLDTSLNYLSKLLLERIVEGYKQHSFSVFSMFLDTENANDFLSRLKYMKTAQENNQKLLIQVQEAKLNFEEQKKLREEKKVQLTQLNDTLNEQKNSLNVQKQQKQRLLTDTRNDEATYQRLLTEARTQLSAFSSFAKSSGVYTLVGPDGLGKGSDQNYFSQRDDRWGNKIMGNSSFDCDGHPCTVLEAGCLVSSIAMASKKKGRDINPLMIASNPDYFQANTALMKYGLLPNGLRRESIGISEVDGKLDQGYVIVGINYGSCRTQSDHFVVLTKKEGNDYKMYDPLYGPDINFYSHYSQICWAEILN